MLRILRATTVFEYLKRKMILNVNKFIKINSDIKIKAEQ